MVASAENLRGGGARTSGVYDSVPPRPGPGPRKCEPDEERKAASNDTTQWFRAWCARRCISVRDLSTILKVTVAVSEKKLNGKSPLSLADLRFFPPRFRHELILEWSAHCASADSLAHGG